MIRVKKSHLLYAVLVPVLLSALLVGAFGLFAPAGAVKAAPFTSCQQIKDYCADNYLYVYGGYPACIAMFEYYAGLDCSAATCGDDGRVNTNCSAPRIVYCDSDTIYVYMLVDGKGIEEFTVDKSDLPASVNVKTLIKQVGQVKLYLNPDGTMLLTAPQNDGKTYYMVFEPGACVSLREGAEWSVK